MLVEGRGNPLQTMAAYIDLNPVRAGLVEDPKDYRFCGYAEAVVGQKAARAGLKQVWADYSPNFLQAHRILIFGTRGANRGVSEMTREKFLKVLEKEDAMLPRAAVLRCRVRYFTDGAILGSQDFVRGFVAAWQLEKQRKYPPKVNLMRGTDWQGMATIQGIRKQVFG